jgi:hypothetical protein
VSSGGLHVSPLAQDRFGMYVCSLVLVRRRDVQREGFDGVHPPQAFRLQLHWSKLQSILYVKNAFACCLESYATASGISSFDLDLRPLRASWKVSKMQGRVAVEQLLHVRCVNTTLHTTCSWCCIPWVDSLRAPPHTTILPHMLKVSRSPENSLQTRNANRCSIGIPV